MKKLMFVAAVAAAMTGLADVSSANVVGYQSGKNAIANNNFVTTTFSLVGYNTADIQQIKISDPDGKMVGEGGIGWGTETFAIWEGLPTPVIGSGFTYYDPINDPEQKATDFYWGDDACSPVTYGIAQGQAVVINTLVEGLKIGFAGQVPTEAVEFDCIKDNNFTGNPFPAGIDIQNIKISDPDGKMDGEGGIGWGTETFAIWEGLPTPVIGSGFAYYDPINDPEQKATDFYWGDDACTPVTYPIAAGQGVVINTLVDGLKIKIEPPYTLGK